MGSCDNPSLSTNTALFSQTGSVAQRLQNAGSTGRECTSLWRPLLSRPESVPLPGPHLIRAVTQRYTLAVPQNWSRTVTSFELAATGFQSVVGQIKVTQWELQGLGLWNIRDLVGHAARSLSLISDYLVSDSRELSTSLINVVEYFESARRQMDPQAVEMRGRQAGIALGSNPKASVHTMVGAAIAAVRACDPNAVIETPLGAMRLDDYLPSRTFELCAHSLDISRALGIESVVDLAMPLTDSLHLVADLIARSNNAAEILMCLLGRSALAPGYSAL